MSLKKDKSEQTITNYEMSEKLYHIKMQLYNIIMNLKNALATFNRKGGVVYFCVDCMKQITSKEAEKCFNEGHMVIYTNQNTDKLSEWIRCLDWVLIKMSEWEREVCGC
jgi:hypothetical protein